MAQANVLAIIIYGTYATSSVQCLIEKKLLCLPLMK
jgi:hypothetical protein